MLKRILDAVPISMSDFFALEVEHDPRVFFRASELTDMKPIHLPSALRS
jgi:hypothetical protein